METILISDMDKAFQSGPTSTDIKMINSEDAVNQSLDLAFNYNYRIQRGYTNFVIQKVFSDLNSKTAIDIRRDINEELEENFQFLKVLNLQVYLEHENREVHVYLEWELKNYEFRGEYKRIWQDIGGDT